MIYAIIEISNGIIPYICICMYVRTCTHTHTLSLIRSHTGLLGPLAQCDDEIDQLVVGNLLKASIP